MPTSAPGIWTADRCPAGFTLVEVLVVLVIVSVVGSAGVLGLAALDRGGPGFGGVRAAVAALRDHARLSGRPFAIGLEPDTLDPGRFIVFDFLDGRWVERANGVGRLPPLAAIEVDGTVRRLDPAAPPVPLILITPDGTVTPFGLTPADPTRPRLRVDADGRSVETATP